MKTVKTNYRQSVNALSLGGLQPSYYKKYNWWLNRRADGFWHS